MQSTRNYVNFLDFNSDNLIFYMGADRQGKTTINVSYTTGDVAMVSPPCVTNWPRVTGDGNYGTMWGPTDPMKAKFTLDLADGDINGQHNPYFDTFTALMDKIDDKLLDFVHANQLKILGRKNLSRDEVKMLQIRTIKPKYDKQSGSLQGHSMQLSTQKYAWDGCGGKFAKDILVCDKDGHVVAGGNVAPGDIVSTTMYVNQVYTGVGGDKFGIHWAFEDVQVVCQRRCLAPRTEVSAFKSCDYEFAQPFEMPVDHTSQFVDMVA